jgi:hypothetical protein
LNALEQKTGFTQSVADRNNVRGTAGFEGHVNYGERRQNEGKEQSCAIGAGNWSHGTSITAGKSKTFLLDGRPLFCFLLMFRGVGEV